MQIEKYASKEFPLLSEIDGFTAPEFLYFQTQSHPAKILDSLPDSGLAVVGTRYPQRRSFELLERVIRDLRGTDLVIVSGFARGIDSRAHELAIEYGLKTVAILGCGMDIDYPRENRHLRRKIVDSGGLLLSHFPLDTAAFASNFLERNQLIAAFARATWVVEAAEVSGTLNTANWAMKHNRNLYATSCFPEDPFFKGNEKLLSQRQPNRYPIAEPLFGAHSLSTTWSFLSERPEFDFGKGQSGFTSKIQKWVAELESGFGTCQVQTLMNHASAQGLTLGAFYLEFEKELEAGSLIQEESGRVYLPRAKCRT